MPAPPENTATAKVGPQTLTAPIRRAATGQWIIDLRGLADCAVGRLTLPAATLSTAQQAGGYVLRALLRGHSGESVKRATQRGELELLAHTATDAVPAPHAAPLAPTLTPAPLPAPIPAVGSTPAPAEQVSAQTAAFLPPMTKPELAVYEKRVGGLVRDFLDEREADEVIRPQHRRTLEWQLQIVLDIMIGVGLDLFRLDRGGVALFLTALQHHRQRAAQGRVAKRSQRGGKAPSGFSAKTRRKYVHALSAFLTWLGGRGLGPAVNPVLGHPRLAAQRKGRARAEPRPVPALADVVAILDYATTAPRMSKNPWLAEAFVLGFHSGLRPIELWGLTVGDVVLRDEAAARSAGLWPARGWLAVRSNKHRELGKSPADRHVPIWPAAAELLKKHLETLKDRHPDAPLFPKPGGGVFRRTSQGFRSFLLAALGPERGALIDAYTWRHAYISLRLRTVDGRNHPVTPQKVAEEVGHGSTTMIAKHYARPVGVHQSLTSVDYREALQLERAACSVRDARG